MAALWIEHAVFECDFYFGFHNFFSLNCGQEPSSGLRPPSPICQVANGEKALIIISLRLFRFSGMGEGGRRPDEGLFLTQSLFTSFGLDRSGVSLACIIPKRRATS
jgi:hypothetical protein